MDTSGDPTEITVADTRQVFDQLDDPATPLSTSEVANYLDCPCGVAYDELETLAEQSALKRREIGTENVWWQAVEGRERPETTTEDDREEEYRTFVQAVEDYAIFMLDPDGHVKTWNEGAERIEGYEREEVIGEHLSLFYPDDADSQTDPDRLLETAATEGSIEDEGWRVRKDGEQFWARSTITALHDENDELRGFAKITRDLSERHEREEELRRERDLTDQFRLLVQSVEEYAIFMMDPEGYIRSWNAGAEQVKGYSRDEIVGEHFSVFYTDEAIEEGVPERNIEKARETGHTEDEGWRVREDGEQFWANVNITAIRDDGELRGFAKVTRDLTERHEFEEQLRREKERFEQLVREVQDYAIFMLDPEGHIETWNEGAERIKGYEREEVIGEHLSLFYPEDDVESASSEQLLAQAAAQGRVAAEGWRIRKDGSRFWASVVITAIYDDGTLRGFAKITRDLTDRKRREDRLAALDEMGRALLEAETPVEVTDIVIEAAVDALDFPLSMIALYDDESGTLQPTSLTPRAEQLQPDLPFLNPATGVPWDVFGSDEPLVVDDLSQQIERPDTDFSVTSGVIIPLGSHGVFITGFTTDDGPDDEEIDFAKIVAADLEAALDQTDRQEILREREATLEEQTRSLERLNRINGVIRTIDQALVDANSREEIERAVCNELATAGPYRLAWMGHHDSATETITPQTWAGIDADYVEDLDLTADDRPTGEHPASVAARLREPYAVQDIKSDPPFEPWRKEALKRGFRSMISVPVLYEDSLYGILTVQADEPDTFNRMERQVIEELGETIAHAINALESKQALVSDDIVELEFTVRDPEIPILKMVDQTGCTFELDSVLSREDGSLSVFFTTRGAAPADIDAFVGESFAFTDLRHISGETAEECVFEATVSEESLVATLLDHGAVPETITAEDGQGRVVVDLSSQADVREFVEMLQAKYPGSKLTARRTRDRAVRTPQGFKAAFEDRITDRQREVLQTAYFSGFFDSPRKSTGVELGEVLGVSQPTVNHHLRASQRELLGLLYEEVRSPATLDS